MINVLKTTTALFVSGTISMASFADTQNPYAEAIERFTKICGEPSAFEQMRSFLDPETTRYQITRCDPQRLESLQAKYRDYEFMVSEGDDRLFRQGIDIDTSSSRNIDSVFAGSSTSDLKQHATKSQPSDDTFLPTLPGYFAK